MKFDKRKILAGMALVVFIGLGTGASYWGSERLKADARQVWLNKGENDAARLTETILFWVSKAGISLRAIAGQFQGQGSLDAENFSRLIHETETWDPDTSFSTVAFVQRIPRNRRPDYEKINDQFLTIVGNPRKRAPDSF